MFFVSLAHRFAVFGMVANMYFCWAFDLNGIRVDP
jgi:hypothetical protein